MGDLRLKTLAMLREYRPDIGVEEYLQKELRQNWKALQQFVADVASLGEDLTSSVDTLSNRQRTTSYIASFTTTSSVSFSTASSIEFTSSKGRIRATLAPATITPTSTNSPSIQFFTTSTILQDGIFIRIRNTTTSQIIYQGKFLEINQTAGTFGHYISPVLWGEIDVDPGTHTYIVEARVNAGSITANIQQYNFTIEDVV